jgi:hypothetical protein
MDASILPLTSVSSEWAKISGPNSPFADHL